MATRGEHRRPSLGAPHRRIDSFIPDQEVVSRKNTQLSGIEPSTANSYLNELVNKYGLRRDDIVIADTPSNQ